jgi:hypothetical protein
VGLGTVILGTSYLTCFKYAFSFKFKSALWFLILAANMIVSPLFGAGMTSHGKQWKNWEESWNFGQQ